MNSKGFIEKKALAIGSHNFEISFSLISLIALKLKKNLEII
jgi:hypothetical protein